VRGVLWKCQSAVKKTESILAYTALQSLHLLALTETWIIPENTAIPAALSTTYSFSHIPPTLWARWGNETSHLSKVVIPGPFPGTPD